MTLLKRSTGSLVALLGLSLGLKAMDASAGSVSHSGTFPLSPYLNSDTYTFPDAGFPKFNLDGQCLNSVCVRIDGGVTGLIGFEKFENFPKTITVYFAAAITLQRPDLSPLLTVQPDTTITENVTAFDGNVDYDGTSGRSYFDIGSAESDSLCLTGNADLALFSGAGTINLPGFATDVSFQTNANSWSIGVRAYATITVTYNYTDCIIPIERTTWGGIKSLYR